MFRKSTTSLKRKNMKYARWAMPILFGTLLGWMSQSVILAVVDVTYTPSGSTTGGAGVLIPDYYTSGTTGAQVDDGSPLGDVAWLSYRNTDSATAEDSREYVVTMDNGGVGDDTKLLVYLEADLYVEVGTQNAPGDPKTGSYKTDASASGYVSLWLGADYVTEEAHEAITNNSAGNISTPKTLLCADPNDPTLGRSAWFASAPPISTLVAYGLHCGAVLEALRPEVEVGAQAQAGNVSGELIAWDYSDPLNPAIAKQSDGTDAIWNFG